MCINILDTAPVVIKRVISDYKPRLPIVYTLYGGRCKCDNFRVL